MEGRVIETSINNSGAISFYEGSSEELEAVRKEIEEIDREILSLLIKGLTLLKKCLNQKNKWNFHK